MIIDKHIKLLKYIMYFLLIISMIFGLIDNAFAMTDSIVIGGTEDTINVNDNYYQYLKNVNLSGFRGYKNGYLTFVVGLGGQIELHQIQVIKDNGDNFICDIGSTQGYKDSPTQLYTYTAKCNVDFHDGLVNKIQVYGYAHTGNKYISISSSISYYSYDTDSSIVTAINNSNSTSAINNMSSTINNAINNQSQQQHQDSINTQNKINDIDNTLKDSSIDNPSSNTSNWGNMNASNGVITNLLTLPIQLMQGYVNGLNSSCTPFNLGNLFGTNITLPCINIGALIGSSLWGVIDVLFSGFMIFGIAKKLIKIFNDFTNMKGNQVDELYGGGA